MATRRPVGFPDGRRGDVPLASTGPADAADAFDHFAYQYEGLAGFLAGVVPFVQAGLDADEGVVVAVDGTKIGALRDALGADARLVRFLDMRELGRNPARIIPTWRSVLDEHVTAGRRPRGVGEPVWAGRSAAELRECEIHESLLNVAFADGPAWSLLCPYDVIGLDPDAMAIAHRAHPSATDGTDRWATGSGAAWHVDPFGAPLPSAPAGAAVVEFAPGPIWPLRRVVAGHAVAAGLAPERVDDLVLAVSEIATNSLVHGAGIGTLRLWTDGTAVVCEVEDAGRSANRDWDPLVGRWCPPPRQPGGRGLWVANQLCDLVQLSVADGRTLVRMHQRLA